MGHVNSSLVDAIDHLNTLLKENKELIRVAKKFLQKGPIEQSPSGDSLKKNKNLELQESVIKARVLEEVGNILFKFLCGLAFTTCLCNFSSLFFKELASGACSIILLLYLQPS